MHTHPISWCLTGSFSHKIYFLWFQVIKNITDNEQIIYLYDYRFSLSQQLHLSIVGFNAATPFIHLCLLLCPPLQFTDPLTEEASLSQVGVRCFFLSVVLRGQVRAPPSPPDPLFILSAWKVCRGPGHTWRWLISQRWLPWLRCHWLLSQLHRK